MTRYRLTVLAFVLAGCIGCGSGADGDGGSPTGPTGSGGGGAGSGTGCTRPPGPGNFAANVSGNSVVFTWSPVNNAIDYTLLVGSGGPGTSNVLSTNTSQTNYNWNGVNRGTYHARVEARNSCGSGASSNEVSFTIS